jgi:hypothetical protein
LAAQATQAQSHFLAIAVTLAAPAVIWPVIVAAAASAVRISSATVACA